MKTKRDSTTAAIPTVYRGIQLKSRLEAQCAFLLDRLDWEWKYEPQSYMLPNGVSFTPDFLVPNHGLFIECRGYESKKGALQIKGLRQALETKGGFLIDEAEDIRAGSFLVLHGDKQVEHYERGNLTCGMCLILHCRECGWWLAPISSKDSFGEIGTICAYCQSCISPLNHGRKWDGKALVDKAIIVTVSSGRILVNGEGLEDWGGT